MDFTLNKYNALIESLLKDNYSFQTFKDFILEPKNKSIILRHDVDLLPQNSLRFARIQNKFGIKGSYYFRAVPESWNKEIILEISELGHEIGYHYETMDTARGNIDLAMEQFLQHLNELRELVEVKTICMHGSPRSKFDNKDLWRKYNYKDYGIIGEPYYDIDFDKVLYLTDTGRKWDGASVSVRDKVSTILKQTYNSTDQIINAINNNTLHSQVMFTFHPQRWHDDSIKWINELISQNLKNIIKRYLLVK